MCQIEQKLKETYGMELPDPAPAAGVFPGLDRGKIPLCFRAASLF